MQIVAHDSVHAPWLPPRLETSAAVISTIVIASHSRSTPHCKAPGPPAGGYQLWVGASAYGQAEMTLL